MSIIFLHGFPLNKSCWDDQVNYFKPSYSTHALDLRGHGKAPTPPGPWMIHHFADDLRNYMDSKKIEKAIICGVSMGGYIALQFTLMYPDRVAGLVLSDTRADADSNEVKDKRYETLKSLHTNFPDFAEKFSKSVLGETSLRDNPDLQKKIEGIILENKPGCLAYAVGAMASRRDSFPHLSQIRCPSLVLAGTEDRITPPEVNELMSRKIPNSSFFKIDRAAHLPNLEQPQIFNQHLMQFLLQFKNLRD